MLRASASVIPDHCGWAMATKAPASARAGGNLWPGFLPVHRFEIGRMGGVQKLGGQTHGKDVPQLAIFHRARMQLLHQGLVVKPAS